MRNKAIFFTGVILLIVWLLINIKPNKENRMEIKPTPTPLLKAINFPQINFNDKDYSYSLVKVSNISKLTLMENKNKEKGKDLIKKYKCQTGINAGFYDKNNQVIGLFFTDGYLLNEAINSKLFDGFFSINEKNQVMISRQNPETKVKIALQSGPMLYINNQPIALLIQNDKPARRMIAFLDENNQLYFLTVLDKEFYYQGPNLVDLPMILGEITQKERIEVKNALNLDGGSASFFHSPKITLEEYNPVGSLFCVK